jgi:hypothetical protein
LYEAIPSGTDKKICSDYFDPLGTLAPSDLSTITNFGRFRALVNDLTNTKVGQSDFYFALTNKDSVQIFVQFDSSKPLLRSLSSNHICDEIWKDAGDKPIPYLTLKQVLPTQPTRGTVSYTSGTTPILINDPCTGGNPSKAPGLCLNSSSDMSVVIHHAVGYGEPLIYAIEPIDDQSVALCTGKEWDVSTAISAALTNGANYLGWVCLAARAVDNVGNFGISAPLRVCLDDGTNPHRCDNTPPPSCTDDCTPPPHFPNINVSHSM